MGDLVDANYDLVDAKREKIKVGNKREKGSSLGKEGQVQGARESIALR